MVLAWFICMDAWSCDDNDGGGDEDGDCDHDHNHGVYGVRSVTKVYLGGDGAVGDAAHSHTTHTQAQRIHTCARTHTHIAPWR
jgi:hypothetical protein